MQHDDNFSPKDLSQFASKLAYLCPDLKRRGIDPRIDHLAHHVHQSGSFGPSSLDSVPTGWRPARNEMYGGESARDELFRHQRKTPLHVQRHSPLSIRLDAKTTGEITYVRSSCP